MSWFPFVSRGRYEDLKAEVSELKEERRKLLDRILELSQQKAIYHPAAPPAVSEEESKPQGPPAPPRRRLSLESVRAMANDAAHKAAGKGPPLWTEKPKVVNA